VLSDLANTYRKLAESRPEAFLPDLAMSLNNLGTAQSELGHREAALASTQEALDTIWPFFLHLPAVFEQYAGGMLRNLRERLQALNRPPSADLQQRLETFGALRRA
jgi:hypothetical protein